MILRLFVLGALLLGGPGVAEQQKSGSHAAENKPNPTQQPVQPTHVIVDQPITVSNGTKPESGNGQPSPPEKPLPRFARPEWVIVYVTVAYTIFAWRTLVAIKRQVKEAKESSDSSSQTAMDTLRALQRQADHLEQQTGAMRDYADAAKLSAETAQANIKQWVDIELADVADIPVNVDDTDNPVVVTQANMQAFNNTPLPLTIKRVVTNVADISRNWLRFEVEETTILPPRTPNNKTHYPFLVHFTLSNDAAKRYLAGTGHLTISGTLFFEEASGNSSEQGFSWVMVHGPGKPFEVMRHAGKFPTQVEDNDGSPN